MDIIYGDEEETTPLIVNQYMVRSTQGDEDNESIQYTCLQLFKPRQGTPQAQYPRESVPSM